MAKSSPFTGGNLKVVLLSVLAATTFWFFSALNKNYNARINYPLEFEFQRDSVVIMSPLPPDVQLDVSSGGWNLLRKTFWFNVTPILITLDNPTDVKFLTRSSILPIISDQLTDLDLNFVLTDTLFINVEEKVQRKIKVAVDSSRIPVAANYRLVSSIEIEPDSINVIGPVSLVNSMPEVYTLNIDRRNIDDNFRRNIDIQLPNENLMLSQPDEVNVLFNVAEFTNVTLPISVERENFPTDSSAWLKDSIVYVNYWIRSNQLQSVTPDSFAIMADYAMAKDSFLLPVMLSFPESIEDLEYLPDTLSLGYGKQ